MSAGSNEFSADAPVRCLTGAARSWTLVSDGAQLSLQEAAVLQGFRPDCPFTGSRAAAFQQVAEVVLPLVAAAVLAGATGRDREEEVIGDLAGLHDTGRASGAA